MPLPATLEGRTSEVNSIEESAAKVTPENVQLYNISLLSAFGLSPSSDKELDSSRLGCWNDLLHGNVYSILHDDDMFVHLNSHTNMTVLGRKCCILRVKNEKCSVSAFTDNVGTLPSVMMVDAVLAYDCPKTAKTIYLVFLNALYIPSMHHHLVPPCIMREAGVEVNEVPKIHCANVTNRSHSIWLEEPQIKINLELKGIFSRFKTRKPTYEDIQKADTTNIVHCTPNLDSWNPYSTHWSENETNMVDYKGDLIERKPEARNLLPEDADNVKAISVSSVRRWIRDADEYKSIFSISETSFIDNGLKDRPPLSCADLEY